MVFVHGNNRFVKAFRSSALWRLTGRYLRCFGGLFLVYSPGFTLLMGSYFAGTITENTSHNRFNINNLETVPGSHLALFVFQLSETLLGIGVQERH